eukprot:CAMPEP_0173402140 /NCGR_PEP_ID=MMETSP1356-20130122/53035_1 /TAXON_ID=77927 ORGANISM="Hemiselmis virescens, Strain PCC157" /NCGR_SAMPLE_ID=MMETSP1356 /ASSEMBLY_ACC=CAM_ASM_000847 /LENGTH=170 /DNA_ID=CAMNT_0014362425 /DNA_START=17 /DNA_END=526 /DNA_ORIENTATION=+
MRRSSSSVSDGARQHSLFTGMLRAMRPDHPSPPRTPMARSPRSSRDGTVANTPQTNVSRATTAGAFHPRCETPKELSDLHWRDACRDAIQVAAAATLEDKELTESVLMRDQYHFTMGSAKRYLLEHAVALPTGTPLGPLGVQRPVTAEQYQMLGRSAAQLAKLDPMSPAP